MARVRLGVALLLPEPWRTEVDGLRRAIGDQNLTRIAPHITLIPPINVKADHLQTVFDNIRNVASNMQPFSVQVGPVTTFAPLTPVIKLDVQGEYRAAVERLQEQLAVGVLSREAQWPFDPHVTLHDDASEELIAHALATLDSYVVDMGFREIWVLHQDEDRVWRPFADFRFERSISIGTGGLAVSITATTLLEPTAAALLELYEPSSTLTLTARAEGRTVGALVVQADRLFRMLGLRVVESERGRGVGSHLVRHARYLAQQAGFSEMVDATGCADVAGLLRQFSN